MIQEIQRYYRPSNNYNKKPATFVTGFVAKMGEISNLIINDMKILSH
jgi:hypothetical protein